MDPNPDCPHADDPSQCRITVTTRIVEPIQSWTPVYDGNGMMTNTDPNTHVQHADCETCGGSWDTVLTEGVKSVTVQTKPTQNQEPPPAKEA